MKSYRLVLFLLLVSLCSLFLGAAHAQTATNPPPLPAGTKAPDIRTQTVAGKPFSLQSLRGKVVLVDYWATWCIPCRMTTPLLESLYKKYGPKGFVVVGMSVDDDHTASQVPHFVKAYHMTYPVTVNPHVNGQAQMIYNDPTVPAQYLIDRKGIVRWSQVGDVPHEASDLPKRIKKLLAE